MKVWVIGGTSGIGSAVAKKCEAEHDFAVVTGTEVNVRYKEDLRDFWDAQGGFDGVVYSAGINELSWIRDMDMNMAFRTYDISVLGFLKVLQIAVTTDRLPVCRSVVAISSDAAVRPMRTSVAYCASKAALDMAVRCAARELAPLRVNAVSPGMIDGTEMTRYIDETVPEIRGWSPGRAREYENSQVPIGRRGTVEEIAQVTYDVLHGPDFMTGSIVTVNGGR